MAFQALEISTQDGRPVALYKLEWGNTVWRYTSADRDLTYAEPQADGSTVDYVYTAVAISDDGMTQGGSDQNDLAVQLPSNLPVVTLFRGTPPSLPVWLTIRRMHFGDTDAAIYWIGTLVSIGRPDLVTANASAQPLTASFKRTGLRLTWTRGCPHLLYDKDCTVIPEDYKVVAHITAIEGNILTIAFDQEVTSAQAARGYFDGGYFEWYANADLTLDRRGISASQSTDPKQLYIFGFSDGLSVGLSINLYPGCSRTSEVCDLKFGNLDNYGGFDFMAEQSPFNINLFL